MRLERVTVHEITVEPRDVFRAELDTNDINLIRWAIEHYRICDRHGGHPSWRDKAAEMEQMLSVAVGWPQPNGSPSEEPLRLTRVEP